VELGPRRFRAEGSRRIARPPIRARNLALARKLRSSLFAVLRARQRCEKGDEIFDLLLGQGEGLVAVTMLQRA